MTETEAIANKLKDETLFQIMFKKKASPSTYWTKIQGKSVLFKQGQGKRSIIVPNSVWQELKQTNYFEIIGVVDDPKKASGVPWENYIVPEPKVRERMQRRANNGNEISQGGYETLVRENVELKMRLEKLEEQPA